MTTFVLTKQQRKQQ